MHFYKNGNYMVCIMNDGTKIRKTEEDEFIPSFAENCDVMITEKCKMGCKFCYAGCTPSGKHGELFKYKFIESLHPYTEMALNGNDLDHPEIEKFLEYLKEKKVFANITVHQEQFMKNLDTIKRWADEKLIHGIGVSLTHATEKFIQVAQQFPNLVLHTINGVISPADVQQLKGSGLKMLILGYKDLERGVTYRSEFGDDIKERQQWMYDNLDMIIKEGWLKVISFDNLAIEQLDVKRLLEPEKWEEFYMGDDGHYTFYIDMVNGTYAKNSLSQVKYPIGDLTIDEMFQNILKNN